MAMYANMSKKNLVKIIKIMLNLLGSWSKRRRLSENERSLGHNFLKHGHMFLPDRTILEISRKSNKEFRVEENSQGFLQKRQG